LVLLTVAVLVAVLLSRAGGPAKKKEPGTPKLTFTAALKDVAQGNAPDPGKSSGESSAIVKMFTDFYQTAFVDPKKWGDGKFEDLVKLFAKEVQPQATKDLPALTIGEARTELKRVDPMASTLNVTVYYDKDVNPQFAVATANFAGRGTLKQSGPPLNIAQSATFYLHKEGGDWVITAYDTNQNQEQQTPSPSPPAPSK
jgi:hypothetical protein